MTPWIWMVVFVALMLAAMGKVAVIWGAISAVIGCVIGLFRTWWRNRAYRPPKRDDDDDGDWRNGPGGGDWTGPDEVPLPPRKVASISETTPPQAPEEVQPPWRDAA